MDNALAFASPLEQAEVVRGDFLGFTTRAKRILVVEDNPITQLMELKQLCFLGCLPRAVSSGPEAVEAMRQEHFDLVLMDCRLPELNGYETVRAIRTFERIYDLNPVTIVAVTGESGADIVDKCLSSGMDGYVSKPISISAMRDVLLHFLP